MRILMSRDSAAEFKKALAKTFDQMESMTALMEGNDRSAILSGRNDVVVNKIKEVLAYEEAAPHRGVLRRRAHAGHRGIADQGYESEGRRAKNGSRPGRCRSCDNGGHPHFLVAR